ncbi:MAG: NYN domain-containing protein [Gammaproteobacteria bacterium]|nr:NYN domain-containing protein [Gammaproteobacteria bacterium]
MDRVAVFVDAGYLYAEGSRALAGRPLTRSAVVLDPPSAVSVLTRFAREQSGLPLLRIYWYDGTAHRPTRAQVAVSEEAGVKLRLGRVDGGGRQKGVDALMASDLVGLARNRAMTDCVLLTGDDELRLAVAEIQQLGVRVHLLAVAPAPRSQSRLLRQEADSVHEWSDKDLVFMSCRSPDSSGRGWTGGEPGARRRETRGMSLRSDGLPGECVGGRTAGVREVTRQALRRVLIREFAARTGRHPRLLAHAGECEGLHSERGGV